MCVQYHGGDQYRGVFSTVGIVPWGISSVPWGYHEYCGVILSTVGDIMIHMGDIMSTMEGVQYHGGYHSFEI